MNLAFINIIRLTTAVDVTNHLCCPRCFDPFFGEDVWADFQVNPANARGLCRSVLLSMHLSSLTVERHHLGTSVKKNQSGNIVVPLQASANSLAFSVGHEHACMKSLLIKECSSIQAGRAIGQLLRSRMARSSCMTDKITVTPEKPQRSRKMSTFNLFQQRNSELTGVGKDKRELSSRYKALMSQPVAKLELQRECDKINDVVTQVASEPIVGNSTNIATEHDGVALSRRTKLRIQQRRLDVTIDKFLGNDYWAEGLAMGDGNSPLRPSLVDTGSSVSSVNASIKRIFGFDKQPTRNPKSINSYLSCGASHGGVCSASLLNPEWCANAVHNFHEILVRNKLLPGGKDPSYRLWVELSIGSYEQFILVGKVVKAPRLEHMCKLHELVKYPVGIAGPELWISSRAETGHPAMMTSHMLIDVLMRKAPLENTMMVKIHKCRIDSAHRGRAAWRIIDLLNAERVKMTERVLRKGVKRKSDEGGAIKLPFGLSLPSNKRLRPELKVGDDVMLGDDDGRSDDEMYEADMSERSEDDVGIAVDCANDDPIPDKSVQPEPAPRPLGLRSIGIQDVTRSGKFECKCVYCGLTIGRGCVRVNVCINSRRPNRWACVDCTTKRGVDLTEARHNVKALLQAQASLIIKFGVCLDEELKCTIESLLGYFNTIVRDLEDVGAGV